MKPKPNNFLFYKPDHDLEKAKLENFLRNFLDNHLQDNMLHGKKKYMIELVKNKYF